jgi:uncharacterized protein YgiM (DUF1202 family)
VNSWFRKLVCTKLFFIALAVSTILGTPGCGHSTAHDAEVLYVSATQAFLRDHVAAVYAKTGSVHNGDRVTVLEHSKRWVRVRDERNEEGWIQERYLVDEAVFRAFNQLYSDHAKEAAQAHGALRNDFRLHVTPGRQTDRLFLLKEGEKVDMLQRASVPKNGVLPPPKTSAPAVTATDKQDVDAKAAAKEEETEYSAADKDNSVQSGKRSRAVAARTAGKNARHKQNALENTPLAPMEDWWLVRDAEGHAGWVLARMIDLDVPLDIAQYAEGQRIIAYFPLTAVHDSEMNKDEPYYLVLLSEPRDGQPFDYNQVRVFSWNLKRHRYETAYRDRNVFGLLPVTVGHEAFDRQGVLPVFTLHVRDQDGQTREEKYKLEGVLVKRVLAPGEQPFKPAKATPERAKLTRHRNK